ncbi:hypothetical protein RJ640_007364 [Escallonia rubra]|uniref:Uncharacterized protein n=1 Tax=Escallonia rubra TaxID=112253 RepID=A0AA88RQ61_9ASTE|nr:hypothetical protein RJ640_007364 [Escallonia rubra]
MVDVEVPTVGGLGWLVVVIEEADRLMTRFWSTGMRRHEPAPGGGREGGGDRSRDHQLRRGGHGGRQAGDYHQRRGAAYDAVRGGVDQERGPAGQLSLSGAAKAGVAPPPPPPAPPSTAAKTEKLPAPAEAKEESTETASNAKSQKHGSNLPAAVRVVCKTLGKSRSASAAVAAAPPGTTTTSQRRDDSLLQQQDGIQSAILHCKRSFKAARDSESSILSRQINSKTQIATTTTIDHLDPSLERNHYLDPYLTP